MVSFDFLYILVFLGSMLIILVYLLPLGKGKVELPRLRLSKENRRLTDEFEAAVYAIFNSDESTVCKVALKILHDHAIGDKIKTDQVNLQALKDRGFYNEGLFQVLTNYEKISFGGVDETISSACLDVIVIRDEEYLIFGADSAGEFRFAIKQFDDESIFELAGAADVDNIGNFCQFVLLRYFYEQSAQLTTCDVYKMLDYVPR